MIASHVGSGDPYWGPHALDQALYSQNHASSPRLSMMDGDYTQFFQNDSDVTWWLCPQLLCRLITTKEKYPSDKTSGGLIKLLRLHIYPTSKQRKAYLYFQGTNTNTHSIGALKFCHASASQLLLIVLRCSE